MGFFGKTNSGLERAAMALATACGIAHAAFFTLFVWRVIGRDGVGSVGWAILALFAALGMGLDFVGFWLLRVRRGKKLGYLGIAASTAIAGVLLAIATYVT